MAEWYTTRIIKPIKIYETKLNTWVNLDKDLFKHPYVLYSYKYLKLTRVKHNTLLTVTVERDRVKVSPKSSSIDTGATIVYLLVMESDESPLYPSQGVASKAWVNRFLLNSKVNNIEIKDCSASNDFTIKIDDRRKFKCMIIPTSMSFVDNMDSYKFDIAKVSTGNYKVTLQQSGSTPQAFSQRANQEVITKTFNNTSTISVVCSYEDIKLFQRDPNLYLDVYQDGTRIQRLICRESDDLVNVTVGTGFLANFILRISAFDVVGLDMKKPTTIKIHTMASDSRLGYKIEGIYFENLGRVVTTQNFNVKVVVLYE